MWLSFCFVFLLSIITVWTWLNMTSFFLSKWTIAILQRHNPSRISAYYLRYSQEGLNIIFVWGTISIQQIPQAMKINKIKSCQFCFQNCLIKTYCLLYFFFPSLNDQLYWHSARIFFFNKKQNKNKTWCWTNGPT